jgi:Flp pilus assembly protein TadD
MMRHPKPLLDFQIALTAAAISAEFEALDAAGVIAEHRQEMAEQGPLPDVQGLFAHALHYHRAGRLSDAERFCQQVLSINPYHADSLHLLGLIGHQTGRHDFGIDLIRKAIAINTTEALYHFNLGNVLKERGRLDEASAAYHKALALKPDDPRALNNLGNVLREQGRLDEASAAYHKALALKPDDPIALNNLGLALQEQGRLDEAIVAYQKVLALKPDDPRALNNLGNVLREQGCLDEAIVAYQKVLALKPDDLVAPNNLGLALQEQGRLDEAIVAYQKVLALKPDDLVAPNNLGLALQEQGRLDEAIVAYQKVLALKPDEPVAHLNLAETLLAQGNLTEGWKEHEWRRRMQSWQLPQWVLGHSQWRGEAAPGRRLLIPREGGFGDTLLFCRYATMAAAHGLRVTLEVQKPLIRLLRCLPEVSLAIEGEELPTFDLYCPLFSLPLALGTTLTTIPSAASYLNADKTLVADWQARLATRVDQGPRIGLVWAGNPYRQQSSLAKMDRRRSLPPQLLAPLFSIPRLHFFSLQKDGPEAPENFPLADFMNEMADFADTAALVTNLDLVISVDTAVAHLAAALGKPVWMLDRFDHSWRWLAGRRDSPWYPTMRIYRQPRLGDWDSVLAEVVRDLRDFAKA